MDEEYQNSWNQEISVGNAGLQHPNILQIIGCGKDELNLPRNEAGSGTKIYTVTELAPNGELFDFVQLAGALGTKEHLKYCKLLFWQLINAVEATHAAGIAHRDIKLENCFLSQDAELKLADFGLMK